MRRGWCEHRRRVARIGHGERRDDIIASILAQPIDAVRCQSTDEYRVLTSPVEPGEKFLYLMSLGVVERRRWVVRARVHMRLCVRAHMPLSLCECVGCVGARVSMRACRRACTTAP